MGGEDEDDAHDEEPVAGDVDRIGRIDQAGGRLGDAQDQGVAGAREQVAGVSARHGGEACGQTRQRMAARCGEDDGRQRDDHDIGGVRRVMGHHARDHDDGRQYGARGVQQGAANGGGEHPGAFGDRSAIDDGDDDAEGRKVRQRARHADDQLFQIFCRQQALGDQLIAGDRIDGRPAQAGADHAEDDQTADQPQEQEDRIGKSIADPLDSVQGAAG